RRAPAATRGESAGHPPAPAVAETAWPSSRSCQAAARAAGRSRGRPPRQARARSEPRTAGPALRRAEASETRAARPARWAPGFLRRAPLRLLLPPRRPRVRRQGAGPRALAGRRPVPEEARRSALARRERPEEPRPAEPRRRHRPLRRRL